MLYDLYEALRIISIALWPYLPGTSENIRTQLGLKADVGTLKELSWEAGKSGVKIDKGEPLFPRIEVG